MRKRILTAAAAVIISAAAVCTASASDLSQWAAQDYALASATGLITPEFAAEDMRGNITREEFCELAMKLYTQLSGEAMPYWDTKPFSDTSSAYVTAAYMYGIVSGVTDTEFMPDRMLTRQELAAMLVRVIRTAEADIEVKEDTASLAAYSDSDEIAVWARPYVAALTDAGIMNGMDGAFEPLGGATREQAASIAARACEKYAGTSLKLYTAPAVTGGEKSVSWESVPDADGYYVIVKRDGAAEMTETVGADVLTQELPSGSCSVSVAAVYEDGVTAFSSPVDVVSAEPIITAPVFKLSLGTDEKYARIFGGSEEYASKDIADANMTTVTVDVWKLKSDGTKTASTAAIEVNKALAEDVKAIFTEIFNDSSQFPIKDVGGYCWRDVASSGSRSQHSYGTCIDINYNENYYIRGGNIYSGSYWRPGSDPYSIEPDGIVVRTFAKYGWAWGGNAWSSSNDYMHFSYLGK